MNKTPRSTDPATEQDVAAVERCFDAYGADLSKWPAEMRARYETLAMSAEFDELRDDALALDGFLNASTKPRPAADLQNRILAGYEAPAPRKTFAQMIADLGANIGLAPAGALAAVGALGIATGVITAEAQTPLTPEYEAYAYLEDSLAPAVYDEEGVVLWDAD